MTRASTSSKGHPGPKGVKTFATAAAAVGDLERRQGKRAGMWTYTDAGGTPVMCVVRFDLADRKEYRPVHRTAEGKWMIGAAPKPRPLYRLPRLANRDMVLVFEGEKATDAAEALGFAATTSAGGAQAAGQSDWTPLAGKDVVILPDHDKAGRKYAADVVEILAILTPPPRVKVVELPGLPEKGDIVEWIAARAGKSTHEVADELAKLIDATPAADTGDQNDRPDNPHRLATGFLKSCGANPVRFFRGGFVVYGGGAYSEVADDEIKGRVTACVRGEFVRVQALELAAWQAGGQKGVRPTVRPVTTRVVSDVMNAIRSESLLPAAVLPPAWIDGATGPDPKNIIAVRNGLLDINTEVIRDPDPRFFTFNALSFDFVKDPPRPIEWEKFLVSMWGDSKPKAADTESLISIQEWFGYLLSADTSLQKMLWIIGPLRSGKGTIARVLKALVGERNYAGPTLNSLAGEFGLAPLLNRGVAVIADARLSGRADTAVAVERMLSITGEDTQPVNIKHRPQVDTKLPTRIVVMSNEMPKLPDAGGALAGRVILLRLIRTFFGNEDVMLTDRLLAELPGILAWAIDGLKSLRKRGHFQQPTSGAELLNDLKELSSPVGEFVRTRCVTTEPESYVTVSMLFLEWKSWCDEHGRDHPGTQQSFGRDLRAAVPTLRDYRSTDDGGRQRGYKGIRLRRTGDPTPER